MASTSYTANALVRTLLAYKRGEPRVCAMVQVPIPEEEDRLRLPLERKVLLKERIQHGSPIRGLLFGQGASSYEPLRRDCRQQLDQLRTGDGRSLHRHLQVQIGRELDRLELVLEQLRAIEAELQHATASPGRPAPIPGMPMQLKGIGNEFATVLWTGRLYRHSDNRRQVAAYAGLAPTLWQSGSIPERGCLLLASA
jgi:transposase